MRKHFDDDEDEANRAAIDKEIAENLEKLSLEKDSEIKHDLENNVVPQTEQQS